MSLLVQKTKENGHQEVYKPKNSFEDFPIHRKLKENIQMRGYTQPTPIQDQTIPLLLEKRDVVGIANTGTGKTAAFLIPIINQIFCNSRDNALIIAPTRELAAQTQQEFNAFSKGLNLFSVLCIGGVGSNRQKISLSRGCQVAIGTPGRLKDLYAQRSLDFSHYNTVVLDEVDRMLDMGFVHDVKFIISKLPQSRHSLFFSATLSAPIFDIIRSFTNHPTTVSVKSQETPRNVDQDIIRINGRPKFEILDNLLRQNGFAKVLVFGRTKWGVQRLAQQLAHKGHRVAALHGNKNQNQRQRALEEFRNNKVPVLLATDIASRGLDIADITHVINYDLPNSYEDYVHRIGRTGRVDKKGVALSFVE